MSPAFNPPAEAIALHGLACGIGAIQAVVSDGANCVARRDMMISALEGAMAFQKGLGAVHALSHPLGAIRSPSLHHGTLNAVLLPAVLRFNKDAIGPKWYELTRRLGGTPDEVIAALNANIGLPAGLREMGVTEAMMIAVSHAALEDHCHLTNPRRASQEDYLSILMESA